MTRYQIQLFRFGLNDWIQVPETPTFFHQVEAEKFFEEYKGSIRGYNVFLRLTEVTIIEKTLAVS